MASSVLRSTTVMRGAFPVVCALVSGILLGLFLGERTAFLGVVADGYIRLLQMTVLPFIVVSTVAAIGRLNYSQAWLLARHLGVVLLGLWSLALLLVFLFPLVLPHRISASFFSSTLVEPPAPLDLLELYVPSNPFYSLANSIVPAVVLFSIVMGVALIGVPQKERLLDVLDVVRAAVAAVARFVVRLVPIGLFAIAAHAAGTLDAEQLSSLQAYVIAYCALSLLFALWMLPALVSTLTGIPYRVLLTAYRDPVLTAFVTSDLFIVLPALTEQTRELIQRHGLSSYSAAPDVIVPASFNFPHAGKVLTLTFILFAAWFADVVIGAAKYPALGGTGLLVLFGNINVAMPFMLDMFGVPADTYRLFIATGFINGRFGSLLAAAHTASVAVLGTWLVAKAITVAPRRLWRYGVVTVAMTVLVVAGLRVTFNRLAPSVYTGDADIMQMELLTPRRPDVAHPPDNDAVSIATSPTMTRIRQTGTLRVGYLPDSLPFAYVNGRGALVGFDIDMANRLAAELNVGVMFVSLGSQRELADCACDIVMSGVPVTTDRAARLLLSPSYLDETVALVVADRDRGRFTRWADVRNSHLRLAVPDLPYFVQAVREALPVAEVVTFTSAREMFDKAGDVDAFVLTAERGSSWTLLYPQLSVVVPMPAAVKVPLAYVIPDRDPSFAAFVGTWIDLKKKDGTVQSLYDHWILGRSTKNPRPRWSVIRDVLHWVD